MVTKSKKKPEKLTKDQRVAKIIADAEAVIGKTGPVEIVDKEAYNEFINLCSNPVFHELKDIKTSTGATVSVAMLTHNLKKAIQNLPQHEQEKILKRRELYNRMLCTRNAKLKQAYKIQVRRADGSVAMPSVFAQREQAMIELFGRMFSIQEVHQICMEQWQLPVSMAAVGDFRIAHWKEIERLIEEHKRTYSDIRLGHKRSRLEELVWLYNSRKTIYQLTKKADDHRLLMATLEQVRKEVEGDSIRIDGAFGSNVEQTVQEHLQKELFKNLPLKELVLARISARIGKSPEYLINDINRSYYGTMLMKNAEEIKFEEMPAYPSTQTYDFEFIKNQQEKNVAERKAIEIKAVEPQVVDKGEEVKQRLLAMLKQKSEKVNFTKNTLQSRLIDKNS